MDQQHPDLQQEVPPPVPTNPGAVPPTPEDAAPITADQRTPSRHALWIAMGAVLLALALVWYAPGLPVDEDVDGLRMAPLHYTLKDMNGTNVRLESFKGKVILVNFWATWCLPCKAEIPDLIALQTKYRSGLVVLGISVDDTAEQIKPFAAQYKVNYPMLVGNKREDVQDALGPLGAVPVTVIIDREGRITKRHTGLGTREQFETEIKPLL